MPAMGWLAHVGGRTDLPVPLSFFIVGAAVAIVASFLMLSANWTTPRLQGDHATVTRTMGGWVKWALAVVGIAAIGLVIAGGLFDGTATVRNIAPALFWIGFWLIVPFVSAVIGGVWRWLNPYRYLVHGLCGDVAEKPDLGSRLGVWPATVGFLVLVWIELVYPSNTLPYTLAALAILYGIYMLILGRIAGPETALQSGETFEQYTDIISHIAPLEVQTVPQDGPPVLVKRPWLRALPHLPIRKGTTAFIVAMIGTVTYDGMSGARWWQDAVGDLRREQWFETIALLATVAAIGLFYLAASSLAGRLAGSTDSAAGIADSFAHSLVPIAFAYAFAHYFTLVIFEGQQILHNASDPFGRGWDLFGTADWAVMYITSSQSWVWYVQVAFIVAGHIAGVVLAHDRALALFGEEVAVRTQYAMLALMVALTSLGLFILAG